MVMHGSGCLIEISCFRCKIGLAIMAVLWMYAGIFLECIIVEELHNYLCIDDLKIGSFSGNVQIFWERDV